MFVSKKYEAIPDYIVRYDIWDTAGQERFSKILPTYYRNSNAVIIAYDITNYSSFERAKQWISDVLENANPDIVIALCGNKIDLEESRKVKSEEASAYSKSIGCLFIEVSAKNNINIINLFEDLAHKIPKLTEDNKSIIIDESKVKAKNNWACQC